MQKGKFSILTVLMIFVGLILAACGGGSSNEQSSKDSRDSKNEDGNFSVAMVTDVGGVDDKSFNQSAWKGLQEFGEENNLEKGDNGFDYLQSNSDADYIPNLNTLRPTSI